MAEGVALAVMCKAPASGESKTRLCPPLSPDEAAALSRCFIADVASTVAAVAAEQAGRAYAAVTPAGCEDAFAGLLPEGMPLLPQRGPDLSARLVHASRDLLHAGHAAVCLINADGPTLPAGILVQAVAALGQEGDRVVIAPAIDGGYALIGLKRDTPSLFDGLDWSTSRVLTQTLVRAAALRLPVSLLPCWYDVDDEAALELLFCELFSGGGFPLAARGIVGEPAPRTRTYLQALLLDAGGRFPFVAAPTLGTQSAGRSRT